MSITNLSKNKQNRVKQGYMNYEDKMGASFLHKIRDYNDVWEYILGCHVKVSYIIIPNFKNKWISNYDIYSIFLGYK